MDPKTKTTSQQTTLNWTMIRSNQPVRVAKQPPAANTPKPFIPPHLEALMVKNIRSQASQPGGRCPGSETTVHESIAPAADFYCHWVMSRAVQQGETSCTNQITMYHSENISKIDEEKIVDIELELLVTGANWSIYEVVYGGDQDIIGISVNGSKWDIDNADSNTTMEEEEVHEECDEWNIDDYWDITVEDVERLRLILTPTVQDEGVVAISQLPNIEILNFSWLNKITGCSLTEIGRNCLKLWKIDLTGCDEITLYSTAAFYNHPTLEVINLFSCGSIFWDDVISLGYICQHLHTLGLSINILGPWAKEHPEGIYMGNKYCYIEWK
ncbi:leucine-rich repeat domain, L domain-like protein [Artemisia annua]|uniref:Leucine-rich repeat domain, L domain-like protein n=1 Tax=Artemisia annua TaxID=35608 RepID=A0A2U1MEJ0_ARTAN|nr:leucine-rich repeat domain, L domain-like protein [Artemisia annua]